MQRHAGICLSLALLAPAALAQRVITTLAGTDWIFPGDSKPALDAPLGGLLSMGMAADSKGNYYIADPDNSMVFKVTPDGILHVIAGNGILGYSGDGGPGPAASLSLPVGVALDAAGNVYICDQGLALVRKVTPDGTISTVAGGVGFGYAGDGGPATSALFNGPRAITVDAAGNIYLADTENFRVRKISTDGTVNTIAGTGHPGLSGDGGPANQAQIEEVSASPWMRPAISTWRSTACRIHRTRTGWCAGSIPRESSRPSPAAALRSAAAFPQPAPYSFQAAWPSMAPGTSSSPTTSSSGWSRWIAEASSPSSPAPMPKSAIPATAAGRFAPVSATPAASPLVPTAPSTSATRATIACAR
jgi:hypothetical protein